MRFLFDQSADARLVPHLRDLGHDVTRVDAEYPAGLPDVDVLALAYREGRILTADDNDFCELVFRYRQPHAGVILFRLGNFAPLALKVERIDHVLANYGERLHQFLVVGRRSVRVRQP